MMGFGPILFVLIMLMGGIRGGNDALDAVPTETYWQIQNVKPTLEQLESDAGPDKGPQNIDKLLKDLESSEFQTRDKAKKDLAGMGPGISGQLKPAAESKDPEVAAVAADLMKQFAERGRARAIRRLMAIRTLGERKEQGADPLLKSLEDSKELFVAEYAARAAAQIEGRLLEIHDRQADFQHDVGLLPKSTGIVVQATGAAAEKISMAGLVDQLSAAMDHPAMPPGMPQQPKIPKVDKQRLLTEIVAGGAVGGREGGERASGWRDGGGGGGYWTQWGVGDVYRAWEI